MTDTPDPKLRPRRSVLYMPGSNARAMEKAASLPADALILDLEDAVAPDAKATARQQVTDAVGNGYGHREVAIRVNGLSTPWYGDDLDTIAEASPDAVLIPKVNNAEDVTRIEADLADAGVADSVRMWAMLETPEAVLSAASICAASDRLEVLVMGTNDLITELQVSNVEGRLPLITSLSWCVLAARRSGKAIIDGVYNDLADLEGFVAECQQGLELGFDGKTVIHPRQLNDANRIFAPSDEQIAAAHQVVEAFRDAQEAGEGVATVDGQMVEELHVRQAQRLIAKAERIAALD